MMGSPEDENGHCDDETQHQVTLTRVFWMMETEVTQEQWYMIMGTNPSNFKDGDFPVECVSWDDCQDFCRKCLELGLSVCLPTEAQWEYACRAGTITSLYNGEIEIRGLNNAPKLDSIAWYGGNSMQNFELKSQWNSESWPEMQFPGGSCGVHPVGKKQANPWGFYDMIGNITEWCSDWYGVYPNENVTNPVGSDKGIKRVGRGCSWSSMSCYGRSAWRGDYFQNARYEYIGVRFIILEQ